MPNFKKFTSFILVFAVGVVVTVVALRFLGFEFSKNALEQTGKIFQNQKVVEEESAIIDVVQKVSPSVVSIAVENSQTIDPFGFLGQGQGQPTQSGIGTGFVVDSAGLIVTNKHVVSKDSEKYVVLVPTGGEERKIEVSEIHRDPFNDLAILKVNASDLAAVELGDSDILKVGQTAVAIGNALGRFENTVTVGVVSGLGRGVAPIDPTTGVAERLDDLVQTDAAINPGNSGGPLVNSAGQVIAVNTAVASAENIGFAIKINIVKQLISDFTASGGKISRPFMGVRYTHISKDVALLNEVPQGELVRQVVSGSSADSAGIEVGDIIVEFEGQTLDSENALSQAIRSKKVGDQVAIKIFRDGETSDLSLKLGEAPNE